MRADLVKLAKGKEMDARKQFKVYSPVQIGTQTKDVVDTRWVLTWKETDGNRTDKARLVAKGYQGPDLRDGNRANAAWVSGVPSHSQLISLSAVEPREIWSFGIRNAFPKEDGRDREACARALHANGIPRVPAAFGN